MKKNLLCLSLILIAFFGYSQKKQNVYFLKNNGKEVFIKDSADFTRIIQEPDSGSVLYNLMEYYPDNSKKRIGKVSKFDPALIFEGMLISFYKNGKKQEVTTYNQNKPAGLRYFYYENGQLKRSILSEASPTDPYKVESTFKLMSYFDSTGVEMIKDGTGHFKTCEKNPDILEEGDYIEGVKNGKWRGRFVKKNISFEEEYDRGKFISGITTFDDGRTLNYSKPEEFPDFKGGINKFREYVGRTYRFPISAQRNGVNGRVVLSFVVEKDGTIEDIKVIKDLGYDTGAEAIRVVKNSPKWIPGQQHGVPVRASYTLPLVLQAPR